jgi:hypothetical protein
MSRIRYLMGVFTPELGVGRGASYTEIEDGWAIRQVDIFEDYDAWLSSGCHDYDPILELGDCMLCDQPLIIDEYEIEVLGEALLSAKWGKDWREEVEEMMRIGVEISKEQFEEIWAEAMRRCADKA